MLFRLQLAILVQKKLLSYSYKLGRQKFFKELKSITGLRLKTVENLDTGIKAYKGLFKRLVKSLDSNSIYERQEVKG